MQPEMQKSILQMARGAIMERADYEMSRLLANILDPNTSATAKRKLTLTLELRRSDGEADAPPVVQAVPVTVAIPKAEPEETKPDHPDAGTHKDGSAAPETGQAEVREDAVQAAQEPEPALPAKEIMDPVPAEPDRDGEEGDGA